MHKFKTKRIRPNLISPKRCNNDECPFFRLLGGTRKNCWLYSPVPMGPEFRTNPKPDWCKLEKIQIHEKEIKEGG